MVIKLLEKEEAIDKLANQVQIQQELINKQSIENLSREINFNGQQPNVANTATHSSKTNIGLLSQKGKGLIFPDKKSLSNASTNANKVKRTLADYNDLIQKKAHIVEENKGFPKTNRSLSGLAQAVTNNGGQLRSQSVLKPSMKNEYLTQGSP